MPKLKSTTEMGKEHEEFIARLYSWDKAKRSLSSGASHHAPIDVVSDSMVIECESTESQSYRLRLSFWQEVVDKAYNMKQPTLAIRFRDPDNNHHVDLIVVNAHDHTVDQEQLEAFRKEALGEMT